MLWIEHRSIRNVGRSICWCKIDILPLLLHRSLTSLPVSLSLYVCSSVRVYRYVCVYIHAYKYNTHTHTRMHTCICIYMYAYRYIYTCVCVHACMYACTHTHTHTHTGILSHITDYAYRLLANDGLGQRLNPLQNHARKRNGVLHVQSEIPGARFVLPVCLFAQDSTTVHSLTNSRWRVCNHDCARSDPTFTSARNHDRLTQTNARARTQVYKLVSGI